MCWLKYWPLSSGFPTNQYSNQSPQLQRLAGKVKFLCSKFRYDTFQNVNNKSADQSARMSAFVVREGFSCVDAHMLSSWSTIASQLRLYRRFLSSAYHLREPIRPTIWTQIRLLPLEDCFLWSSLIWVYIVCFHDKI